MYQSFKNNLYEIIAPPIILLLLLSALQFNDIKKLERTSIDWRYKVRANNDKAAHEDIVILGVDEESLLDFGMWPWNRERHTQLLEFLKLMPPKVITFDVFFSEHTNGNTDSPTDMAFADAMLNHESVVTAAVTLNDKEVSEEGMDVPSINLMGFTEAIPQENITGDMAKVRTTTYSLYPVQLFRDSSYFGFADADPSAVDGIRRNVPVIVKTGGHVFPSLILQTLMRYYEVYADSVFIEIGKQATIKLPEGDPVVIPINDRGEYYVNYRSQIIFNAHGFSDLLKTLAAVYEGKKEWPESYPPIQDKILLIGQVAKGLSDMGPTPLQSKGPLVFVQANILNNILNKDYLRQAETTTVIIFWLALTWLTVLGLKGRTIWIASGAPIAITVLYAWVCFWQFEHNNFELPMFWPIAGFFSSHFGAFLIQWVKDYQSKARIKDMFGTYISRDLVDQMVEEESAPKVGGQRVEITALFSDIQSFSTFSEQMEPEQLVVLMNEYFDHMTAILQEENGTLDKFIGDAIVAFYGAPLPVPDHAYRACSTILKMQKKLVELRKKWTSEGDKWPEFVHQMRMRIGANTGAALVGNIGSSERFNYTMMGDMVNLAARCESGAKSFGVYSMVTEDTIKHLGDTDHDIIYRLIDKIIVKGRTQPVAVYELVDFRHATSKETRDCLELFNKGLDAYFAQQWDNAINYFEKSSKLEPFQPLRDAGVTTNPSLLKAERCKELKADPPDKDWDGVFVMKTK